MVAGTSALSEAPLVGSPPVRRLIVNADDLGQSAGVNEGILRALRDGIVTSASVLANLPYTEAGIRGLQSLGRSSGGVHLNLTRGRALAASPGRLATRAGKLRGEAIIWALGIAGGLPRIDLEHELAAQIERVCSLGLAISHLDGHHHVHVLPQVAPIVAALARRYGIPALRVPDAVGGTVRGLARAKWRLIGHYARRARTVFSEAGLLAPDRFVAWYARGGHTVADLRGALDGIGPGWTELAVHPGLPDAAAAACDPYARQRPLELSAVCDPSVRETLARRGIVLGAFDELAARR
jgi:predicted glycoside hydrolase/deacetylase ChbG (UPF0249 family)